MDTTLEKYVVDAREGRLSKTQMASLLEGERRAAFLSACARIEKKFTEACTALGDPCLESGCAVAGAVCLQPLLQDEAAYLKALGEEWVKYAGR
jgi:hypothetical protein